MDLLRGRFLRKVHLEIFFLLRPSLTPEARKTTGRHRPSSTFSDGFSASKDPIHSQPPLLHPVRAAADKPKDSPGTVHCFNRLTPRWRSARPRCARSPCSLVQSHHDFHRSGSGRISDNDTVMHAQRPSVLLQTRFATREHLDGCCSPFSC